MQQTQSQDSSHSPAVGDGALPLTPALERFEQAFARLEAAKPFAKMHHLGSTLEAARRLLAQPGGPEALDAYASRLQDAGIFSGTDWEHAHTLKANLVRMTFEGGDSNLVTLECLSELRILAVQEGRSFLPYMSAEQAHHFLTRVLAINMNYLFGGGTETMRAANETTRQVIFNQLNFLANRIGLDEIFDRVVEEVWRMLRQRPVQVEFIKMMITRAAGCLDNPDVSVTGATRGIDSLISALYGPTDLCREDPGVEAYIERIGGAHDSVMVQEAQAFARAMHDTGLVSPYHAAFVRYLLDNNPDLLPVALGLSTTGRDCFFCYRELICGLMEQCVHYDTPQAVLGMSGILERGILYQPGVGKSLWRQMQGSIAPANRERLHLVFGDTHPAEVYLTAGLVSVLGNPLGLGQGNNPVCQSTRAISMWSYSAPDYLLQLTLWAARDNNVRMVFEGQPIESAQLVAQTPAASYFDLDPVSLVLVPHLDRIYLEMGRRTIGRGDDPHRWLNPEFHGWRVNRGFALAVDLQTGLPADLTEFIGRFYSLYHPYHNHNTPLVHPQPAGIAVTDSQARYVGWHAITIQRIMLDQENVMRVYFFNPNNDSGQDWGNGVEVSTHGYGEEHGESSLPVQQFCSRLYLFHYDPADDHGPSTGLPQEEITEAVHMANDSWVRGLTARGAA